MILLFTDFGAEGPYLGQMEVVLRQEAPGIPVVNVVSNAAAPSLSAYLLAALVADFHADSVFLAVVDPGVGGDRRPVAVRADGRWFVGPDNGLFNTLAVQAKAVEWFSIQWRPQRLSASFHGRDLFAPVAAALATRRSEGLLAPASGPNLAEWLADRADIVYVDHYGNALSGIRYSAHLDGKKIRVQGPRGYGQAIPQGQTFSSVAEGKPFWYCNSMGLVEIAVNRGRAAEALNLPIGASIRFE